MEGESSLARELAARQYARQQDNEAAERDRRERALIDAGTTIQDLEAKKVQLTTLRVELDEAGFDQPSGRAEVSKARKPLHELLATYKDILGDEGITSVRDLTTSPHASKREVAGYVSRKAAVHERVAGAKETKRRVAERLDAFKKEAGRREPKEAETDTEISADTDTAQPEQQETASQAPPGVEQLRTDIHEQLVRLDQKIREVIEVSRPLRVEKIKETHQPELQALADSRWARSYQILNPTEKVGVLQTVNHEDIVTTALLGEQAGKTAYQAELKSELLGSIEQGFQKDLQASGLAQVKAEMGQLEGLRDRHSEVRTRIHDIQELKRNIWSAVYEAYQADERKKERGSRTNEDQSRQYADTLLKSIEQELHLDGRSVAGYEKYLESFDSDEPLKDKSTSDRKRQLFNPDVMLADLEKIKDALTKVLDEVKGGKIRGNEWYQMEGIVPPRDHQAKPVDPHLTVSDAVRSRVERETYLHRASSVLDSEIEKKHEPYQKAEELVGVKVDSDWATQERKSYADANPRVVEAEMDIEKKHDRGDAVQTDYYKANDYRRTYKDEDTIVISGQNVDYAGLVDEIQNIQIEAQPHEGELARKKAELERSRMNPPRMFGKEKHEQRVRAMEGEVRTLEHTVGGYHRRVHDLERKQDNLKRGVGSLLKYAEVREQLPSTTTIGAFFDHTRAVTDALKNAKAPTEIASEYAKYQALKEEERTKKTSFDEAARRTQYR